VVSHQQKNRNVLLYGAALEYHLDENNEVVLNYNKSFRPALFSELTPQGTTDVVNPDLKDAQGYNADAFIRGKILKSRLHYQLGGFYTLYANRIGAYTMNIDSVKVRFVNNIGDAVSKGVEALLDYRLGLPNRHWSLNVWAALSIMDVKYTSWNDPSVSDAAKNRQGNFVEYAPNYIHRAGINGSYKKISIQMTSNWISSLYTDALNTINSDAKAASGKLPAYKLIDVSLKYNFNKFVQAQINVNNILDENYATRRAGGYPGPGLLPGNPRNLTFTLFLNI
jgi:Fe(3+) dicitrate transport protein